MKLNNDLIVLDLETTAGQDEHGNQTNNDIIQIGAVLLDRNLNFVQSFGSLVKPREPVSQFITELTGITDEAAQAARPFTDVVREMEQTFFPLITNTKNIRLCAWGTYFDIPILRRQYREYQLDYPFSGTAFDVKTLAMLWMSLSDRRTDKLSVEHVANVMGIEADGTYHDALVDAKTEASILQRIFDDLNKGVFFNGQLIKLM